MSKHLARPRKARLPHNTPLIPTSVQTTAFLTNKTAVLAKSSRTLTTGLLILRNVKAQDSLTWEQALCKGKGILSKIRVGNNPITEYSDYNALRDDRYNVRDDSQTVQYQLSGLESARRAYSWPTEFTTWEAAKPSIGAKYSLVMSVPAGVLVAVVTASGDSTQGLRRFSDAAYLAWKYSCDNDIRKPSAGQQLKFVVQAIVTNVRIPNTLLVVETKNGWADTQIIFRKALSNVGQTLSEWPGTTFSKDNPDQ